jgi:hypothetical protein
LLDGVCRGCTAVPADLPGRVGHWRRADYNPETSDRI